MYTSIPFVVCLLFIFDHSLGKLNMKVRNAQVPSSEWKMYHKWWYLLPTRLFFRSPLWNDSIRPAIFCPFGSNCYIVLEVLYAYPSAILRTLWASKLHNLPCIVAISINLFLMAYRESPVSVLFNLILPFPRNVSAVSFWSEIVKPNDIFACFWKFCYFYLFIYFIRAQKYWRVVLSVAAVICISDDGWRNFHVNTYLW